jgi:hypothetical protein
MGLLESLTSLASDQSVFHTAPPATLGTLCPAGSVYCSPGAPGGTGGLDLSCAGAAGALPTFWEAPTPAPGVPFGAVLPGELALAAGMGPTCPFAASGCGMLLASDGASCCAPGLDTMMAQHAGCGRAAAASPFLGSMQPSWGPPAAAAPAGGVMPGPHVLLPQQQSMSVPSAAWQQQGLAGGQGSSEGQPWSLPDELMGLDLDLDGLDLSFEGLEPLLGPPGHQPTQLCPPGQWSSQPCRQDPQHSPLWRLPSHFSFHTSLGGGEPGLGSGGLLLGRAQGVPAAPGATAAAEGLQLRQQAPEPGLDPGHALEDYDLVSPPPPM